MGGEGKVVKIDPKPSHMVKILLGTRPATPYFCLDNFIKLRRNQGMRRKKLISWVLLLSLYCSFAWGQQSMTIMGTVTDTDDYPIIGATVIVKGTTVGTTTDTAGKYSLAVPPGSILVFSYVGMQPQEVPTGENTTINVKLMNSKELDELVVIGYGTIKKRDLTGAVSSVSSKDLQADIARSASSALQGRVAGVSVTNSTGQPGTGMNINIRGLSSLGNNTPLYVIDGVYGDINMIDPADISSMEILKDASAAAIYGSRAANGVVLITTKSGRKDTPTKVTANVFTGIQMLPKKIELLNGDQWVNIVKSTFKQGKLPQSIANWSGPGTDWQDEVYRTAPVTKANLTIAGGTKTATYSVSAGYINQAGILSETGYDAFNIRAKNEFSFFNDHFRIGNTFILKTSDTEYTDLTITDPLRQNPMVPVYDESKLGGYGAVESWMKNMDNPVGHLHAFDQQSHATEILLNAYAEVDLFLKGLKYKLNVGINRDNSRGYNYTDAYDFGQSKNDFPDLNEGSSWGDQWLIENTLHYDNTFGKHTVSGLFGYSAQENKNRSIYSGRNDLPPGTSVVSAGLSSQQSAGGSANENTLVSIFARAMYSYDSRYMLSASIRRDGSSRFADGHRYGVFPSVSAGWNIMNESFFKPLKSTINELKIRGSYGVLGNQEIGNYMTQPIVNSGINYIQGFDPVWWQGSSTGVAWVSPQDLTWEQTSTFDIGLDAGLFDGRLSLTVDYYNQETDDILLGISMPGSAGMNGQPTMNAGTITNKGLEIALMHRNTVGEVYYNIGANISTVKNNIEAITVGNKQEFAGYNPQGEGTVTWAKVGDPIGAFYLIQTDGIFQTDEEVKNYVDKNGNMIQPNASAGDIRFIDHNGDGKITDDDRQYAGSPFPDLSFGLRGGLEWNGFDFNFFFDGTVGNEIYNFTRCRIESMNEMTNFATTVLNAWTPQNKSNSMPRFTQADPNINSRRVSDRWLENGSYIRLKTLELGYSLPNQWMDKIRIQKLRFYTAMENLFTLTGYDGYTPDLGSNGDVLTRGCDQGRYPQARTITFGLQLDF